MSCFCERFVFCTKIKGMDQVAQKCVCVCVRVCVCVCVCVRACVCVSSEENLLLTVLSVINAMVPVMHQYHASLSILLHRFMREPVSFKNYHWLPKNFQLTSKHSYAVVCYLQTWVQSLDNQDRVQWKWNQNRQELNGLQSENYLCSRRTANSENCIFLISFSVLSFNQFRFEDIRNKITGEYCQSTATVEPHNYDHPQYIGI